MEWDVGLNKPYIFTSFDKTASTQISVNITMVTMIWFEVTERKRSVPTPVPHCLLLITILMNGLQKKYIIKNMVLQNIFSCSDLRGNFQTPMMDTELNKFNYKADRV